MTGIAREKRSAQIAGLAALEALNIAIERNTGEHMIANHSDTITTGAELDELSGGGEIVLHSHAGGFTSHCSVYLGSDQTLVSAITTLVEFDTEDYDDNTEFNTGTHTWTAKANGYYTVHSNITWVGATGIGDVHGILIYIDGAEQARNFSVQGELDTAINCAISKDFYLTIGQTVNIWAYKASGARDIDGRTSRSYMSIRRFA